MSADTADITTNLHQNIHRVQASISEAAGACGRDPADIVLLAVTKRKSADVVRAAIGAGLTLFGENYVQEAVDKKAAMGTHPASFLGTPPETEGGRVSAVEWHLIGHLQSNKAKIAVQTFSLIQGLDSEKLARNLARIANECGIQQRVLIQVHLGDEPTKTGTAPETALSLAELTASLPGLSLEGLMGIAPFGVDPRPHFRGLRSLFDELPAANRKILSMGMSSDYHIAIEEGSTMVRIGSDLFGAR